ncbi:phosphate acetyltransferase [Schaalia sp. lx-100]|uniref:phosphate acetyltransferase n=1 Tax=Schaalia sp. lx-100 TaxID=2899081 RepID=UPI001E3DBB18|nr:phosphate acetyltransferase [Schaalia sp. lx-100]
MSRFLVIAPEGIHTTRAADDLAQCLSAAAPLSRMSAFAGTDLTSAAASPERALPLAVEAVRACDSEYVLIEGVADVALHLFDTFDWSLNLAAATQAHVILALDTEGYSADLVAAEIRTARMRAQKHHAQLSAVLLPAAMAQAVSVDDVHILSLPLTDESRATLTGLTPPSAVTPLTFQANLVDRARSDRKRIVLPEPEDDRVLKAAAEVLQRGIADIILVGDEVAIRQRSEQLGVDVSAASIVAVDDPVLHEKYAAEFARLRQKKGITIEQAREKVRDVSYFGTMMVHMGDADGMVSGAAHTTAHTIVPSFQIIKTAPGVSIVSSIFLMLMADRVWAFGDCAVNPNPTPEQLADIAISSAYTARQFGIEPKVAMLSYSTGTSGSGVDVEAVAEATRIAQEKAPELAIEGPIQFDASVDEAVAATKLPHSTVAGHATVFVFPSLNAGNIGYKAVQRSSGAVAVGPILQGLNKPVNDLSRGALVEDIVNTVALTAVQAQNSNNAS